MPNLEYYRELAAANHWLALWPELGVVLLALLGLVLELLLPRDRTRQIPAILLSGLGALILLQAVHLAFFRSAPQVAFNGLLLASPTAEFGRLLCLLGGALSLHLTRGYLERRQLPAVEFSLLLLVATASAMVLVQAHHFVMLFVALECFTITLYVLVAFSRRSSFSLEAGLKFLVQGGLSSALLLAGLVLLFGFASHPLLPGVTGDPWRFDELARALALQPNHPLALAGIVLVLAGLAFKVGAFPFFIWIPDVYQGAPVPVTAYLAVVSKSAGFLVLANLLQGPFAPLGQVWQPALVVVAGLTILYGNLAALGQDSVKRLMGLSGIAHAGFLLMGLACLPRVPWVMGAVLFYLLVYLCGSYLVFQVMARAETAEDAPQTTYDYEGLWQQDRFLAGSLVIGLASLAGVPPLAGFIAKLLLLLAVYQAGHFALLAAALLGVVLSLYYYFGWVRAATFRVPPPLEGDPPRPRWLPADATARVVLILLATTTVILGLYQGPLGSLLGRS